MNDLKNIEQILIRMTNLLRLSNVEGWAEVLDECNRKLSVQPVESTIKILSLYGGIGSLNDVILYKNGQPLFQENSEFDDLRGNLYQLCNKIK